MVCGFARVARTNQRAKREDFVRHAWFYVALNRSAVTSTRLYEYAQKIDGSHSRFKGKFLDLFRKSSRPKATTKSIKSNRVNPKHKLPTESTNKSRELILSGILRIYRNCRMVLIVSCLDITVDVNVTVTRTVVGRLG